MDFINSFSNQVNIRQTGDGSSTVFSSIFGETYHSIHGAIAESMHVFINAGLLISLKTQLNIFEVGFGTGLNAFLTATVAEKSNLKIKYQSLEKFPISIDIIKNLEYPGLLIANNLIFTALHTSPWNKETQITPNFSLHKLYGDLLEIDIPKNIDLVYFDAFSPESQPELWSENVFRKLYDNMNPGGIIVTYCAKGIVRRTLRDIGFTMERLAGPPPKREMLRGRKGF